jgi:hypothetical protein
MCNPKLGDSVEFEYSEERSWPRWNHDEDYGPSGIFITGEVVHIDNTNQAFLVEFTRPEGSRSTDWYFVLPGNSKYQPDRPGWPRVINQDSSPQTNRQCTCEITVICNRGCQCKQ